MKIRIDFVTNSSSSSFILGSPNETTITIEDSYKYLHDIERQLKLNQKISYEYIIDLRWDEHKIYEPEDICFVVETILWYSWIDEGDQLESIGKDPYDAEGIDQLVTDDGIPFELEMYNTNYTKSQQKAILDYAYQHYGEILIGNSEQGFYPYDAYYEGIALDDKIKYKCNHMG